jgi:hypothetical protein
VCCPSGRGASPLPTLVLGALSLAMIGNGDLHIATSFAYRKAAIAPLRSRLGLVSEISPASANACGHWCTSHFKGTRGLWESSAGHSEQGKRKSRSCDIRPCSETGWDRMGLDRRAQGAEFVASPLTTTALSRLSSEA